jgi:mannose-6-phosphate isomerase-like protein (cupin superfamily)/catechol 2,3-dioxygenase-like lactoylglutathione lyase family enzyme
MTIAHDTVDSSDRQIVSEPATSRAWWFLGTLALLRNPEGAPRAPSVIELTIPPGGSPPRHIHERLDDSFLLLDGEIVVRCGGQTLVARPGTYVVLPHGVEHTFRVTSQVPARLLLVHADDSFLRFIEALGTPTEEHALPPPGVLDLDLDVDSLMRASADHGAPMVGPPLDEDEARRYAPELPIESTLGAVHHLALNVTDLARSERWYTDAFGLVRVDGEVAADGTGHVVLLSPAAGWMVTLASSNEHGIEHVALNCSDRAALLRWRDGLRARGLDPGTVTDAPYGSGFVLRDPDNVQVELFVVGQHDPSTKQVDQT